MSTGVALNVYGFLQESGETVAPDLQNRFGQSVGNLANQADAKISGCVNLLK